ncbi:MAG: M16 family metallopeptidase [Thiolinea sp.]
MLSRLCLLSVAAVWFLVSATCNAQENINYQTGLTDGGLKTVIWATDNDDAVKNAELKLVIKTGSLAEEDDERGYAHFVEHLAFNNTAKYPKESLFRELEAFGLSFGAHSNAQTGFDSTIYKLTIKDVTAGKLDKAMEILSQWAMHVQFDQKTVDAEKGVIREEWRLRKPQETGWQARYIKELYRDSRFADRLPIGELEVIESATAESLEAFYQRWYQPENSALIVTGHVESDVVNKLVDKYFSPWQQSREITQQVYNISPESFSRHLTLSDKKVDSNSLQFSYFIPLSRPDNREEVYERQIWVAALDILKQRLDAQVQETAGKVSSVHVGWNYPSQDILAISVGAIVPGNGVEVATRLLAEEIAFLLEKGVTESELEAWKAKTFARNRTYTDNAKSLANQAVRHVMYDNPLQEQSEWLNMLEQRLPELERKTVNERLHQLLSGPVHSLVVHNPDIEVPTAKQMQAWISSSTESGAGRELSVADDQDAGDWPIQPSKKGEITAERTIGKHLQEWKLNNGIDVYYRYSDHKPGRVWYQLSGIGGTNNLNQEESIQARLALETIGGSGLRDMNGPQLDQWLTNNNMSLQPYFGFFDRGIYGDSDKQNFARLMRLLHISLTEAKVADQAWQHNLENNRQQLGQLAKSRTYPWRKQTDRILYANDAAFRLLTLDELNAVKPEQLKKIYDRDFAGAQNYQLAIVGDLSEQEARAAVEESIATLPKTVEMSSESQRPFPGITQSEDIEVKGSGDRAAILIHKLSLPKSAISGLRFTQLSYLRFWLDAVLLEELREKDGLVYSVNTTLEGGLQALEDFTLTVQLGCDPDKVPMVKQRITAILQQLADTPPEQERLAAWQKTRAASLADSLQKPVKLASAIMYAPQIGLPLDKLEDVAYRTQLPEAKRLADALGVFNSAEAKKIWLTWLP